MARLRSAGGAGRPSPTPPARRTGSCCCARAGEPVLRARAGAGRPARERPPHLGPQHDRRPWGEVPGRAAGGRGRGAGRAGCGAHRRSACATAGARRTGGSDQSGSTSAYCAPGVGGIGESSSSELRRSASAATGSSGPGVICLAAATQVRTTCGRCIHDISCRPLSACTRASTSGRCQGGVSGRLEPARHHHRVPTPGHGSDLAGHHARQMGAEVRLQHLGDGQARHVGVGRDVGLRIGVLAELAPHRQPQQPVDRWPGGPARARAERSSAWRSCSGKAPMRASSSSNQGSASSGRAVRRRRGLGHGAVSSRQTRSRRGSAGESNSANSTGLHAADAAHPVEAVHGLSASASPRRGRTGGVTLPVMMRVSSILRVCLPFGSRTGPR